MYELSCSIVAYNNPVDIIGKAINSVLQLDIPLVLFVYDNSPKDTLRSLCNNPRLVYVHDPANPGFSKAHNYCIRQSMGQAKHHLVLNPDVYFEKETLELLIEKLNQDERIGLIAPKIYYPDHRLQYSCRMLPSPTELIVRRLPIVSKLFKSLIDKKDLAFTNYKKPMHPPFILGCFMLIPMSVFQKAGLFDERFFMYMEDFDLCRRIKRDYLTLFEPSVVAYHVYERSSSKKAKLLSIHLKSAYQYFNKWGWFFDSEREKMNSLQSIGVDK
jgi:GT2 family glycosyltransferase